MRKKEIAQITILDTDFVKVIPTLNNIDIRYTERNRDASTNDITQNTFTQERVKRLSKETYLDFRDDIEKKYNHKENRIDNESSFYRSKRELNWLILNSFTGERNEIFLTLTHKEATNYDSLNVDFRNFMRRLKNYFKRSCSFDYISVREPHLSGKWHLHVLLKFKFLNDEAEDYYTINKWNAIVTEIWKNGITHIQPIDQVNELATYLTRHLTDIIVDENGEEIEWFSEESNAKTTAKNARLRLYPQNMKIYSYSKSFKKPPQFYMTYAECKMQYDYDYKKNWDNSILLYDDSFAIKQRQIQYSKKNHDF